MRKWIKSPLIEKRAQLLLSLTLLQYLVLYTCLLIAIIVTPSIIGFSLGDFSLEEQYRASREFLFLHKRVVPYIVLVMLIEAVHFLFITHRIFGPLHRLDRVLRAWGRGSWPELFRVRRKDYHRDLAGTFNAAAQTLKTDFVLARDLIASSVKLMESRAGEVLHEFRD